MKNRIIAESISLPEIPAEVLNRYPGVVEAITKLEEEGFPILSYDASLGALIRLSVSCYLTRQTVPVSRHSAHIPIWCGIRTHGDGVITGPQSERS